MRVSFDEIEESREQQDQHWARRVETRTNTTFLGQEAKQGKPFWARKIGVAWKDQLISLPQPWTVKMRPRGLMVLGEVMNKRRARGLWARCRRKLSV